MAQLYRRIPRLPHRALIVLIACVTLGRAHAQEIAGRDDPSLARLQALAAQLDSPDPGARERAVEAMGHLDADMLPAIRARVVRLERHRPEHAWAFDIYNQIRRAAGSERADDEVDIADGVLPVLAESRRERVRQMVEPLLLLRSLERMHEVDATVAMIPIFLLDDGLWRLEAHRICARLANDLVAPAILARGHDQPAVRSWARTIAQRLGADEPGRLVQQLSDAQLSDVLRTYASTRVQGAMRVSVAYAASDERSVRRAARWAIEQYGGNAIWVLRTAFHERTGEQAPREWGWRRVATELYARIDADRLAPVHGALDQARDASARSDLAALEDRLSEVLARAPDAQDAGFVAASYARIADAHASAGRIASARRAYRRALRVSPEDAQAHRWRAELAFIDAEERFAAGVLDVSAYVRVLALHPDHEGAERVLATLEPPSVARDRLPEIVAALCFVLLGLALVWRRRRMIVVELDDTADPLADTLADSTIPG